MLDLILKICAGLSLGCVLSCLGLFLLLTTGCKVTTYRSPDGTEFRRTTLGVQTDLSVLEAKSGDRELRLEGFREDGSEALGRVAEGAARGAAEGSKP